MKIYLICFNNERIEYSKAFLSRDVAEEMLKKYVTKYKKEPAWYHVKEIEVESKTEVESVEMTLEEVFDL